MMPGTYYARNRERCLEAVKSRQAKLGDSYREANKLQMRRRRRRRHDHGQLMLSLAVPPPHAKLMP